MLSDCPTGSGGQRGGQRGTGASMSITTQFGCNILTSLLEPTSVCVSFQLSAATIRHHTQLMELHIPEAPPNKRSLKLNANLNQNHSSIQL